MTESEKNNILIKAIRQGQLGTALEALAAGADIEAADPQGRPGLPLRIASLQGNAAIVLALLERGANAQGAPHIAEALRPMQAALRGKHTDVVHLLSQYGADLSKAFPIDPSAHPAIPEKQSNHEEIIIEPCYGLSTDILNFELGCQEEVNSVEQAAPKDKDGSLHSSQHETSSTKKRWFSW